MAESHGSRQGAPSGGVSARKNVVDAEERREERAERRRFSRLKPRVSIVARITEDDEFEFRMTGVLPYRDDPDSDDGHLMTSTTFEEFSEAEAERVEKALRAALDRNREDVEEDAREAVYNARASARREGEI